VKTDVFRVQYACISCTFETDTICTLVIVICAWTSSKRWTYSLRIGSVRSTWSNGYLCLHSILIHDKPSFVIFVTINTHSWIIIYRSDRHLSTVWLFPWFVLLLVKLLTVVLVCCLTTWLSSTLCRCVCLRTIYTSFLIKETIRSWSLLIAARNLRDRFDRADLSSICLGQILILEVQLLQLLHWYWNSLLTTYNLGSCGSSISSSCW